MKKLKLTMHKKSTRYAKTEFKNDYFFRLFIYFQYEKQKYMKHKIRISTNQTWIWYKTK